MRHAELAGLTLEVEYASQVNWSLLHAGVPFLFKFVVRGSFDPQIDLWVDLSILSTKESGSAYLNRTRVRVSSEDARSEQNLAGVIHAELAHQWLKRQAWSMGDNVEAATLLLQFPDGRTVSCPVDALPPTYWYRAIDSEGLPIDRLATTRATMALAEAHITPELLRSEFDCAGKAACPPLAAAIAAFIDRNDPYVRRDGGENDLGSNVAKFVRVLQDNRSTGAIVLQAFYEVIREATSLRHVDFLNEYAANVQAVRLLKSDRERGALCLDLVVLGCEVLESWDYDPVFILTQRGRHAVLGVWSKWEGFGDGSPVCMDAKTLGDLLRPGKLTVLDVTLALSGLPYVDVRDSPLALEDPKSGFVYAVDIKTTRAWPRAAPTFRILPLPRPRASAAWVGPYLERMLPADLGRQLAQNTQPPLDRTDSEAVGDDGRLEVDLEHLDDPDGLFIPARCRVAGDTKDVVINPSSRQHWPPEGLQIQSGPLAVAVLAEGGGGKSYLCRRLARVAATRYLNDSTQNAPVPIFYPLRQLVRGSRLLEALARHVGCSGPEDLALAANHVPLLFILDALDESDFGRASGNPKDYEELLQPLLSLPNTSVLLTGRPAMFPGDPSRFLPSGFTVAHLQDWEDDDLKAFLRACEHDKGVKFNRGWSKFYEAVFGPAGSENLRDLAKTPLFARMIVQTRDLIEFEINEGRKRFEELDLYRKYTRHCFQRKWTLIEAVPEEAAHKEIALSMYMIGRDTLSAIDISKDLSAYLQTKGGDVWRSFTHHGCIIYGLLASVLAPSRNDEMKVMGYRFSHLSFAHYFLATRLEDELRASLAASGARLSVFSTVFGAGNLAQGVIKFLGAILRQDTRLREELGAKLDVPATSRMQLLSPKSASRPNLRTREKGKDLGKVAFRNLVLAYLSGGGTSPPRDLSDGLDFEQMDLAEVSLKDCDLSNCQLRGAILRAADLSGSTLVRADLREADLTLTFLNRANLHQCKISRFRVSDQRSGPRLNQVKNLADVRLDAGDVETKRLLERFSEGSSGVAA